MISKEYAPSTIFDQIVHDRNLERDSTSERMSGICLSLADMCIRYAGVERVPRYTEIHKENDAEHSLMVAVLSVELAHELRPELDKGLLSQFATVHDFVEIAVGDTLTYNLTEQQLLDKHILEQAALESVAAALPPYTARLLRTYEEQSCPESRFVRAVDKLAPLLVDILGPGKLVMREDCGVTSFEQFTTNKIASNESMIRRFGEDNPEIVDIYHHLGEIFSDIYQRDEPQG